MYFSRLSTLVLGMFMFPLMAAGNEEPAVQSATGKADSQAAETLTVYKRSTCGCCREWISHMEVEGFNAVARDTVDLNAIKEQHDIAPAHQSCHTAVSTRGYVFEGHVPARYVRAFLANPPEDAVGLAVPGMPLGSPGMEVGDRFTPYEVLLLKNDGSSEVFARVDSPAQQ